MWYLILLSLQPTFKIDMGYATIYYPGDGHCGTHRADGRRFKAEDDHIAHRTIRLGTVGHICNFRTKKCTTTVVRDRGPFGVLLPCKGLVDPPKSGRKIRWKRKCYWWQVQTRLKKGWKYRGQFDVTRPVARRLKMKAFDRLVFIYDYSRSGRKLPAASLLQDKRVSSAHKSSR